LLLFNGACKRLIVNSVAYQISVADGLWHSGTRYNTYSFSDRD
jgi:hypothetical protein